MAHTKSWGEMIDGRGTVAGGRTRFTLTTESVVSIYLSCFAYTGFCSSSTHQPYVDFFSLLFHFSPMHVYRAPDFLSGHTMSIKNRKGKYPARCVTPSIYVRNNLEALCKINPLSSISYEYVPRP